MLFSGNLSRRMKVIPFAAMMEMSFTRSLAGRVLGYGTFTIEAGGRPVIVMDYIPYSDQIQLVLSGRLFPAAASVSSYRDDGDGDDDESDDDETDDDSYTLDGLADEDDDFDLPSDPYFLSRNLRTFQGPANSANPDKTEAADAAEPEPAKPSADAEGEQDQEHRKT